MPLSISTNIASLTAQRSFMNTNAALETAFERLSSGKRVNSAVDDAAGLAIGKTLESRVSGLNQAVRNTNDGISMVQIAEGALDEVTTILQRMRDLAVQGNNSTLGTAELGYLDAEQSKLATTLNDVLNQASFNGIDLIDTNADKTLTFQVGANNGDILTFDIDCLSANVLAVSATDIGIGGTARAEVVTFDAFVKDADASGNKYKLTVNGTEFETDADTGSDFSTNSAIATALQAKVAAAGETSFTVGTVGAAAGGDIIITYATTGGQALEASDYSLTQSDGTGGTDDSDPTITNGIADAARAITMIDAALAIVASDRADLGAVQAQMESTVRNLSNVAENTAAAQGRIMDTDYAAETANLTKAQILQQAATSILAQANSQPQSVLSLLQ